MKVFVCALVLLFALSSVAWATMAVPAGYKLPFSGGCCCPNCLCDGDQCKCICDCSKCQGRHCSDCCKGDCDCCCKSGGAKCCSK
jgi:hypothetical protein